MTQPAERITPAPGLYENIPAQQYFAWNAVNASFLKRMAQSAAHARWDADNPKEATPAMILGSCTHTATLEPDRLAKRYIVAADCAAPLASGKNAGQPCGNAGRIRESGVWYCGQHARGRTMDALPPQIGEDGELIESPIVTLEQMSKAQAMAISVRKNRAARELIDAGRKEVCIVWHDPATGVLCKMRTDVYDGSRVSDLKTTEDASPDEFPRQIGDLGYDIQAAFYLDGATSLSGELHDAFYFVAVEKSAPFVCAVYKAHKHLIDIGRNRYRRFLAQVKWCKENSQWPGYHDNLIEPINVTRFHFDKESKK